MWLPFLAPVFMHLDWVIPGKIIYFVYSFFCHQLPERSFFLFGQKTIYSLWEIQEVWQNTEKPMILRQFIGDPLMGWKVAWSDRMIWFYTSLWIFAIIWCPRWGKTKPLSWGIFFLLLTPLTIDGITHMVTDAAGVGKGFRDTNAWLMLFTQNAFPRSFYAGDALASFNFLMRFATGVLAGSGSA